MKEIWQIQRDLEEAKKKVEIDFIKRIVDKAFQEGCERGKLEAKNEHN